MRSSPRLRMLSGSQHTMKRSRVASSRWVRLTLRLSLSTRLHRTTRVIGDIEDFIKIDKLEFKSTQTKSNKKSERRIWTLGCL